MKNVIMILAALAFSMSASAQLTVGAKAGLNLSSISLSEGSDFPDGAELGDGTSGTGFHVGGFAKIEIGDGLNFRPELLFDVRGTSDDSETSFDILGVSTTSKTEIKASTSYISIPLLVEYMVSDNIGLHVGPSLGLLAGYKATLDSETSQTVAGETTTTTSSDETTDTDGLNGLDLGLAVGGTFMLDSGLEFGLRYNLGLTDTQDEESGQDFSNAKWGVFQVSVGYAFMRP